MMRKCSVWRCLRSKERCRRPRRWPPRCKGLLDARLSCHNLRRLAHAPASATGPGPTRGNCAAAAAAVAAAAAAAVAPVTALAAATVAASRQMSPPTPALMTARRTSAAGCRPRPRSSAATPRGRHIEERAARSRSQVGEARALQDPTSPRCARWRPGMLAVQLGPRGRLPPPWAQASPGARSRAIPARRRRTRRPPTAR
mmetsp:Transcript_7605/g.21786  ORF Transcript_7605/g.21786 Transcript_7605/m.21786 type:complete len:200 (+) Transcript_7605:1570-2169(+)